MYLYGSEYANQCLCIYLGRYFFHLEAKHYWTMMITIAVLLWIIWGKWCFPCTWCSQGSVLWGFPAEELVNKPWERPLWQTCSSPRRGSRAGFVHAWMGRLQGEIRAVLSCCTGEAWPDSSETGSRGTETTGAESKVLNRH